LWHFFASLRLCAFALKILLIEFLPISDFRQTDEQFSAIQRSIDRDVSDTCSSPFSGGNWRNRIHGSPLRPELPDDF